MTDNNIILGNTWFYNKYIKNTLDKHQSKIQFVSNDSMVSNIISINNLDTVIKYDDTRIGDTPNTLNDYYQKYPVIDLSNKTILNDIYGIYNMTDLKMWLDNNSNKNILTINRVLDLSWLELNKKILYNIDYIKEYYFNLYKKNYNIEMTIIKNIINDIISKYNIKLGIYISTLINDKLNNISD